ncbi:hypothetical protein FRC17_010118 [Serendipita sp. 399]|nr:hypothetical protein FRC17_010118 [Serendipita sp. 399]
MQQPTPKKVPPPSYAQHAALPPTTSTTDGQGDTVMSAEPAHSSALLGSSWSSTPPGPGWSLSRPPLQLMRGPKGLLAPLGYSSSLPLVAWKKLLAAYPKSNTWKSVAKALPYYWDPLNEDAIRELQTAKRNHRLGHDQAHYLGKVFDLNQWPEDSVQSTGMEFLLIDNASLADVNLIWSHLQNMCHWTRDFVQQVALPFEQ